MICSVHNAYPENNSSGEFCTESNYEECKWHDPCPEHNGPDVRSACICGWVAYWTVDAPDTVRDQYLTHLREEAPRG